MQNQMEHEMENAMATAIWVSWGHIGIMENKMDYYVVSPRDA